jgi:hypothetical protein
MLETVSEYALGFLILALVAGIMGGIGAVAIDLMFLSHSIGQVAQWGCGALVLGLCGLGLMNFASEGIASWQAWRAKRQTKMRPIESNARQKLIKGFLWGAGLVSLANAALIFMEQQPIPAKLNGWIDLLIQSILFGALLGGLGAVWGRAQDKTPDKQ